MIEQDLINFMFNNQIKYTLDEDSSIYELEDQPYIDSIFHYSDIVDAHKFTTSYNEAITDEIIITEFKSILHSGNQQYLKLHITHNDISGVLDIYYTNFKYDRLEYEWDD